MVWYQIAYCFFALVASTAAFQGCGVASTKICSNRSKFSLCSSNENDTSGNATGVPVKKKKRVLLSQMKKRQKSSQQALKIEKEIGELRPLVRPAPTMLQKLRGEDYWIDIDSIPQPKVAKKPSKDQFQQEKLKDEIVSPYTKNFILIIILGVAFLIGFIQLNPSVLDNYPNIDYPQEL